MRIEQADQVAYLERLGFGVEADGDDLQVTVPPERHYDVTREVDLIEEVGRVHGFDEHLPTTLPAVAGRSAASAASSSCGGGPRTRCATSASTRSSAGASPTLARRRGCGSPPATRGPRRSLLANPLSEDQSAMRTTLLGSLLDVASRNLARDADAVALFESGQVYLNSPPTGRMSSLAKSAHRPGRGLCRRAAGAVCRAAPVRRPGGRAVGREVLARRRRAGGLLRAQGRAGGACRPARGRAELRAGARSRSCTRAARPRSRSTASRSAGSARFTRWSAGSGTSRRRSASKSTPAPLLGAATVGEETYEDVTTFPAARQDLAVVVPVEVSATAVRDAILAGGGELLRSAASSTSTRASSSARDARAWPCGSSSAPPTAPSPTRRSRRCGSAIKAKLDAIGGTLRE